MASVISNILTEADIMKGINDLDIDAIQRVQEALTLKRISLIHVVAVGSTVVFTDKVRPRYLEGLTATVVRVNDKSVTVSTPNEPEYQRFAGATQMRCPISLVRPVSELHVVRIAG